MRSDTVTRPSPAMVVAMSEAQVGDDVFRDDPTVFMLEQKVADMAGKEAGLFVPSGTMGNLICVLTHCWGRGCEVLLGDKSHIVLYEQGGISQLGGVHSRTVKNNQDGTFSLEELVSKIRDSEDTHCPVTQLVAIENSHNKCGGRALPMDWLERLGALCKEKGLALHCDGARLFNTAVSQGVGIGDLLKHCDTSSICLSKGLGCPVGSVIVGPTDFIQKALRLRKVLGGAMRQVGYLAAAGLYALEHQITQLEKDHRHAISIAQEINRVGNGRFVVGDVDTNIVVFSVDLKLTTPDHVVELLEQPGDTGVQVLSGVWTQNEVRVVFHRDISDSMAESATNHVSNVLKKLLGSQD